MVVVGPDCLSKEQRLWQAAFNDFLNAFSGGLMSSNSDYDALAGVLKWSSFALVNNTNHYDNVVTAGQ